MAQEADHPGRSEALPRPIGDLLIRHLGVGALVMTFVALVGAAVSVAMPPSLGALGVAAIAVPPARGEPVPISAIGGTKWYQR